MTSKAKGTLMGPEPGSQRAGSPLARRHRSWTAMNAQRAATLSSASSSRLGGGWLLLLALLPRLPPAAAPAAVASAEEAEAGAEAEEPVGIISAATASRSRATNCCTVADAVFLIVALRCPCSVRQRRSSCETVVSE
jgi:hypothetical protein